MINNNRNSINSKREMENFQKMLVLDSKNQTQIPHQATKVYKIFHYLLPFDFEFGYNVDNVVEYNI